MGTRGFMIWNRKTKKIKGDKIGIQSHFFFFFQENKAEWKKERLSHTPILSNMNFS